MSYSGGRSWVDVPEGTVPPVGAPELKAATLNALEADVAAAFEFQPGEMMRVLKDPVTGNWPAGWIGRTPVYSGGAPDAAVRPSADPAAPAVVWDGEPPDPPIVASGTGGMLESDWRAR